MSQYIVNLAGDEIQELSELIQKSGKGYHIKHDQILLKLDRKPENEYWTYDRIKDAYGVSNGMIAGVAKVLQMEGMESASGRRQQQNRNRKVTEDVEVQICVIDCSNPPKSCSYWTMQAMVDELTCLEDVDYITDSAVCDEM